MNDNASAWHLEIFDSYQTSSAYNRTLKQVLFKSVQFSNTIEDNAHPSDYTLNNHTKIKKYGIFRKRNQKLYIIKEME